MLGLPAGVTACLFDLDGVLTDTAAVHDTAWTATFDAYLAERAGRMGERFGPFDPRADYAAYVDGKPRADGVRDFLTSRGIVLVAEGEPEDPPDAVTVQGLANRKNDALLRAMDRDGVEVFNGSRRYLRAARDAGLRRAVVSSSANTRRVLEVTGLAEDVEVRIDGYTLRSEGLRGKPAPGIGSTVNAPLPSKRRTRVIGGGGGGSVVAVVPVEDLPIRVISASGSSAFGSGRVPGSLFADRRCHFFRGEGHL